MTRGLLAGLLLVLTVAVTTWGRTGVVTIKDGSTFEGDITEQGNIVIIKRGNEQPVKLNKANVANIEYKAIATPPPAPPGTAAPSPNAATFHAQMAKLAKNDVPGRIKLAQQMLDKKEYDLSLEALDSAIAIDPNSEDALKMRRSVLKLRHLARQSAGQPDAAMPPDDQGAPADGGRPPRDGASTRHSAKTRMVTPEEINRIRQLELQKGEKVQVTLENDVKRRYQQSSEFTPQQFAAMTPQDQAAQILSNGNSQMRQDVMIKSDPLSLSQFKSGIHRIVLTGCAMASCHGTPNKAGDFFLHNPAGKDVDLYTNFMLMQTYKTEINGKELLMVDRARPENSLVLQYGLPQDAAEWPHPKAQNFKPVFKGKSDPKFKQTDEWLRHTLAPIAPDYGIDLTKDAEGNGATTRPARPRAAAAAPR